MSLHGFPAVTSFILSQGTHTGCFNTCLYTFPPGHSIHLIARRKEGGGFNTLCRYLAFPLSLHSSYRKVKRGVVLTYVSTWLSLAPSSYRKVNRGGRGGGYIYVCLSWLCLCQAIPVILQDKGCEIVPESGEIVSESQFLNRRK